MADEKNRSCDSRLCIRPFLEKETVVKLAKELFGLEVDVGATIKELESYDDRNFLMQGRIIPGPKTENCERRGLSNNNGNYERKSQQFVFKVMNSRDSYRYGFVDAIDGAMRHLHVHLDKYGLNCPMNVPALNGDMKVVIALEASQEALQKQDKCLIRKIKNQELTGDDCWNTEVDSDGNVHVIIKHCVRLQTFIPGQTMLGSEITDELLVQVGQLAAIVTKSFQGFVDPVLKSKAKEDNWDLANLLWLQQPKYLNALSDTKKRHLAETSLELFKMHVTPVIDKLPSQTIHSDLNESNIIIQMENGKSILTGLIDFGDIVHSCRIFDLGNCMAYMGILTHGDCMKAMGIVRAQFLSEVTLTELELEVLYYCVIGRIAMSLVIGNYQSKVLDPENEYLLNTAKGGWDVLETLLGYHDKMDKLQEIWK